MRFPHVHSTPERFLLIALVVFPLVFLYNAFKSGKLSRAKYNFLRLVLLLAVIAVFALQNASLQKDKAALCDWLGEMRVVSAGANDWYAGGKIVLSEEDVAAFADALQGLSPESLSEGEGLPSTGDISVSFRLAGNEDLVLKQQGNTVYFMFDTDTAMRFGERNFQTDDGALLDAFFDLVD